MVSVSSVHHLNKYPASFCPVSTFQISVWTLSHSKVTCSWFCSRWREVRKALCKEVDFSLIALHSPDATPNPESSNDDDYDDLFQDAGWSRIHFQLDWTLQTPIWIFPAPIIWPKIAKAPLAGELRSNTPLSVPKGRQVIGQVYR